MAERADLERVVVPALVPRAAGRSRFTRNDVEDRDTHSAREERFYRGGDVASAPWDD